MADMDELDPIRELVVEAMAELEQALVDGLPAQAPSSGEQDIKRGLRPSRRRPGTMPLALSARKRSQRLGNCDIPATLARHVSKAIRTLTSSRNLRFVWRRANGWQLMILCCERFAA
ncbi:MAG TPA: hypothetical protein EYG02_06120 [Henriciella marina]|nr:hypothetical protein [Henriciella marina]